MRVHGRPSRGVLVALASVAAAFFSLPASLASAGSATSSNACANSVTANFSQVEVTTNGADAGATASPGDTLTLSGLSQQAAIPGDIFVAGYNLGVLNEGVNNIPANAQTKIEATNTVEGTKSTNVAGGTPPDGSVTVSTTISDPDGIPGTGDETATDGTMNVSYADLTYTAGSSGTISYRQDSIGTSPPTAANNTLVINALVGGVLNVQFRCAPGTVTGPDPGTITLIDPVPSFDTTGIMAAPGISIDNVEVVEGNSGQTAAGFTIVRAGDTTGAATVDFVTLDDTATAPGDYEPSSGTVTFATGETEKPVTVQVNGDTVEEGNETFNVDLSNATNATIADDRGVGTIINDDVAAPPSPPSQPSPPPEAGGAPPPSNDFSFGKVRRKPNGTAILSVNVPGPGGLELAATESVKGAEQEAEGAGIEELPIKPKGKAKKKLNQGGKAKVEAAVTFIPIGGAPKTESTQIKLFKRD